MGTDLQRTDLVRFGAFSLDLRTLELRRDGTLVNLPPQPVKILAFLLSRSGELVTREEIREEIWGTQTVVDFEAGLNFAINRIRVALGDHAASPRISRHCTVEATDFLRRSSRSKRRLRPLPERGRELRPAGAVRSSFG